MYLVYVASPFIHEDAEVMLDRVSEVRLFTAQLMERTDKFLPITPVGYTFPFVKYLPQDFDYYTWTGELLKNCHAMCIAQIDGWDTSYGVGNEIAICEQYGIPFVYSATDIDMSVASIEGILPNHQVRSPTYQST